MKKVLLVMCGTALMTALGFAGLNLSDAKAMGSTPEKSKVYYVCGCGVDCKCDSMSDSPGKCKCGKDMAQMHLLDIRDDKALFCTCGPDCDCKLNPDDPTKCGCGKPVKVVSLKGKYVCACGPDCKCGSISDNPGKCHCGQEMNMVEEASPLSGIPSSPVP